MVVSILSSCKDHSVDVESFLPEPEWVNTIDAPVLNTVEDVKALWGSKKRCCINERKLKNNQREFYKACYVAVATHPSDQLLVAKCLQLMDSGMDKEVRYQINQHFIDNYFYFKSPIDRCSNCLPADPVARTSRDLAWQEVRRGYPAIAIKIAQRILDERLEEISPFVQMNLYSVIAHSYTETGYSGEQLAALRAAQQRLRPSKEMRGATKHNFKTFEGYLSELLEGQQRL